MARIRTLVTRMFVVVSLSLGRLPQLVRLLDLLQQPSVARVMITCRRPLNYVESFSAADRDGRRAAPIRRPDQESADRIYRWVDTA
jgi:hypothetical protein